MKFAKLMSISSIAELLNGKVSGDGGKMITGLSRIEDAGTNDLTFIADEKYTHFLANVTPGCILVGKTFNVSEFGSFNFIIVDNPRAALDSILRSINEQRRHRYSSFISPSAVIENNCEIAKTAFIGANVFVGDNSKIGEDSVIMPGAVLYNDVTIGKNTTINSNVTIYNEVEIGDNCIIHAGAVIGADGFGFEEQKDGSWIKIPQLGNVKIGNDVEIGANTTVDRALLGSTIIENGVKLDNLIQIAHNDFIGENSAFAALVGLAGSSKVGKRNRFGGQVGLAGHLTTADDVVIMAQSGVSKSIDEKGLYFGSPTNPRFRAFKIEAVYRNLPELKAKVDELEKKIKELEK